MAYCYSLLEYAVLSVSSETGSHNNAPDLNVNSTYAVTMKLE